MPSIKTIFFVKLLSCCNWLYEYSQCIKNNISKFISHMSLYFNNETDTWLFISGHSLPISLMYIYNTIHAKWKYDNSSNKLIYLYQTSELQYSINWLSANIIIDSEDKKTEYEMDDFLSKFRIYTSGEIYPTIAELFNCWCIYTKHWFSPTTTIIIHYIDMMGEEHNININDTKLIFTQSDKNHLSLLTI